MAGSTDYFLVTCSQRRLVCPDVYTARTSQRYQNGKIQLLTWLYTFCSECIQWWSFCRGFIVLWAK
jgi:hypothetical protein